ncbi:hypothetical protein BH11ACT4_BH11ACT4_11690 [soil metagenome]
MRKLALATLALAALALTGCVPQAGAPTPQPTPSATPVFASEEDALRAAEAAYAEYQQVIDASLATYDTARLSEVATGDALKAAESSVESFKSKGQKLVGHSSTDSVRFAQVGGLLGGDKNEPAQIYGCLDISMTDVVDGSGSSVVPATRATRLSMIISLVLSQSNTFLVSTAEVWDGDDFCK